MRRPKTTSDLLMVFINMFYPNLLAKANYTAYWNKDIPSPFSSLEEATDMLSFVQGLMAEDDETL
jgi:hypothetical protein